MDTDNAYSDAAAHRSAPPDDHAAPDLGAAGNGRATASLSFEHSATLVLGRLQIALADLLRSVPGQTRTASEVERAFGIDYKLGWQIHRIANSKNPLAGGANVPARVSMQKLLAAAARRRVPAGVITRVSDSFDAFERLLEAEAGDREELETMLAAFVPETREKRELEIKKTAFKALSQMKGVSMEAQVGAFLLHPSKDGAAVDRATFSAYLGLRRLRTAAHIGFWTMSGTTPTAPVLTLDGHQPDGLHSILMAEHCSTPTPTFNVDRHGTHACYSVAGEHVGLSSALQLVMAEHRPGAMKRYRTPEGRTMSGVMNLPDLPMKRQTTDIFLHRDVYPDSTPQFAVYDMVPRGLAGSIDDPAREVDRVLFEESIRPIVGGFGHSGLTHLPGYTTMLEQVCARLGWNPTDFRGFRLDVLYPVYGAQYMVGFTLPERPG